MFCLSALLGVLVQENRVHHEFFESRTTSYELVREAFAAIPVAEYCARCGVPEGRLREAARRIAAAESVATFEDLGVQQGPHSTLCSYLEKLRLPAHRQLRQARHDEHPHPHGEPRRGREGGRVSPVGGHRIITGLIPANVIPDEILTDHPKRFRAMIIESANPAHSLADSQRMREALAAL